MTARTWFVTGAARGIGAAIVDAALARGDHVVAAVREIGALPGGYGDRDNLEIVRLDVCDPKQIDTAVATALARFNTIDVLVNNAGYGQIGVFETTTAQQARDQFATNVFGTFDVTRRIVPLMRERRSGHIFNISSIAGLRGNPGVSLYAASKFAMEGFSEALCQELEPFGIRVTIVEPGHFRTDFLDDRSLRRSHNDIDDYEAFTRRSREGLNEHNHRQKGDPVKLAALLVDLAHAIDAPRRLPAGTDAYAVVEAKIADMQSELSRWRALTLSTDYTDD